jgi:hypothetical protein
MLGGYRRRRGRIGCSEEAQNEPRLTLIGLAWTRSTELVVARPHILEDSANQVREGQTPRGIRADFVALDHVPTGERAEKLDANAHAWGADGAVPGD